MELAKPIDLNVDNPNVKLCGRCRKEIVGDYMDITGSSYHKDCFTCSTCSKNLADQQLFPKDGKLYCADCYNGSMICAGCGKKIEGEYLKTKADNKKYHPKCFPRLKCARCQEAIAHTDKYMEAIGQAWHPHHFTCGMCNKVITGYFTANKNQPICQNCGPK